MHLNTEIINTLLNLYLRVCYAIQHTNIDTILWCIPIPVLFACLSLCRFVALSFGCLEYFVVVFCIVDSSCYHLFSVCVHINLTFSGWKVSSDAENFPKLLQRKKYKRVFFFYKVIFRRNHKTFIFHCLRNFLIFLLFAFRLLKP